MVIVLKQIMNRPFSTPLTDIWLIDSLKLFFIDMMVISRNMIPLDILLTSHLHESSTTYAVISLKTRKQNTKLAFFCRNDLVTFTQALEALLKISLPIAWKMDKWNLHRWNRAGVICSLRVSGLRLQVSGSAGRFILRGKTSTIAHAQSPNRERAKNCESTGKRGKTSSLKLECKHRLNI